MSLRSIPVRLRRRRDEPAAPARSAVCHAPFTSMYLDQHGDVRACCQNAHHPLGNVTTASLLDIWRGAATADLRRALERADYSLGCEFCEWPVSEGRPEAAFARWYDDFPIPSADPDWPVQLELSISNTCNLQCVMCNGDWSSSIRSQREGRAPLPKVYDDGFFDELRAFVPHLRRVKFLGGEPFLAAETLRVMDLLVELGDDVRCHATTNGTQWSPRVERILDALPVDVAVSMDAATAETYERIRVGSSWELLQHNLDRFQERADANGTSVSVTYCLMVDNWHEFGDFCRIADERGLNCDVNTVTHPPHFSLYRLPADELQHVVDEMTRWARTEGGSLRASRATWDLELDRLVRHLEDLRRGVEVGVLAKRDLDPDPTRNGALYEPKITHLAESLHVSDPEGLAVRAAELVREQLGAASPWLDTDTDQVVVQASGSLLPGGVDAGTLVGEPLGALPSALAPALGELLDVRVLAEQEVELVRNGHRLVVPDWNLRLFESRFERGVLRAVSAPRVGDDGALAGLRLHLDVVDPSEDEPAGG